MSKKNETNKLDMYLERIYIFFKKRLNFDDFQAVVAVTSIILLPFSIVFGYWLSKIQTFQIMMFVTMGLDIIAVIYSVVKPYYKKKKRIQLEDQLRKKSIEVIDMDDVNRLEPTAFEAFVREYYKQQGYKAVVTKASHDHGADVIAEKGEDRVVVQVKHKDKPVGRMAVLEVNEARYTYKADEAVVITNNEFTSSAIKCAYEKKVKLIDVNIISQFFRKNKKITISHIGEEYKHIKF